MAICCIQVPISDAAWPKKNRRKFRELSARTRNLRLFKWTRIESIAGAARPSTQTLHPTCRIAHVQLPVYEHQVLANLGVVRLRFVDKVAAVFCMRFSGACERHPYAMAIHTTPRLKVACSSTEWLRRRSGQRACSICLSLTWDLGLKYETALVHCSKNCINNPRIS
jgi:hypothetical protein